MCVNCFTGVEAAAVQAAAGAMLVRGGLRRVRSRRTAAERRAAAYQANATFLEGIGLDPGRVLGPPPVVGTVG